MSEWQDNAHLPGWQDIRKRAEVETEDGRTLVGLIDYEEMTPGPDEWPMAFLVVDGTGERVSDVDWKRWRPME